MITRDMPGVRLILLGGEALPQPLVERWATPGRRLFNTYGPTEATVVATVGRDASGPARHHRPPDPELHLLRGGRGPSARWRPASKASFSSAGPASRKGYLKRPDLTAIQVRSQSIPGDGAIRSSTARATR
jgi:non-ribosomal peptide synthetase component F